MGVELDSLAGAAAHRLRPWFAHVSDPDHFKNVQHEHHKPINQDHLMIICNIIMYIRIYIYIYYAVQYKYTDILI